MNGSWAFYWVQIIGHNKGVLTILWTLISGLLLLGVVSLEGSAIFSQIRLLSLSLLLMAVVVGFLMDSVKIAFIQFLMSLYILLMTFGVLGLFEIALTEESILGFVVVVTLITSNLVHVLSTLLREMARGSFQYDAVNEALKLNITPLLLSNLTTALGFLFAAWFNIDLMGLALVVMIGVLISSLTLLSWLPLLLTSWLLEFRVGNSADRHGLSFMVIWLIKHTHSRWVLVGLNILLGLGLLVYGWKILDYFQEILWLFGLFFVLFLVFWQGGLALINSWLNLTALLMTAAIMGYFIESHLMTMLVLMMPIGLIVDDGIHFFSRYSKAIKLLYAKPKDATLFAMASVGRPIWITSCVLVVGLSVLLFSHNEQVQVASLMTVLSIVVSTLMMLVFAPALLISQQRFKE
ncbi:MAG: hypothetical protein ISEC1_P0594 [Thiomicrorhabdus sp.]|nr:MAG: hypothetical protein ISEC1_P0594 [Thiomicrorhabdus sp.]